MITRRSPIRRQRGATAVELAVCLPLFVLLLAFPLFLGRTFWHYTAAQKAAQDAARYLSSVTAQEMREPLLAQAAAGLAGEIVRTELAELETGGLRPQVDIQCGGMRCQGVMSGPLPQTVSVLVTVQMRDHLLGMELGRYGLRLQARSVMRYVGN